jgi:hypothetical protein
MARRTLTSLSGARWLLIWNSMMRIDSASTIFTLGASRRRFTWSLGR